ncbi:hypothetical protein CDV31_013121 [Fusarium ambrosium]|uniref:Uncharacterized protein n=1 Tax=Fusarium ambrosium TaxID=131363 RepID=A0A428T5B9_9HYPO|nr:hypothetical protein CDV31_013121 [Fusarium ambrosium]
MSKEANTSRAIATICIYGVLHDPRLSVRCWLTWMMGSWGLTPMPVRPPQAALSRTGGLTYRKDKGKERQPYFERGPGSARSGARFTRS